MNIDIDRVDRVSRVALQIGLDLFLNIPGKIGDTLSVLDQDIDLDGYRRNLSILYGDAHPLAGLASDAEFGGNARRCSLNVGDPLNCLLRQLDDDLFRDMDAALKTRPAGNNGILSVNLLSLFHSNPS